MTVVHVASFKSDWTISYEVGPLFGDPRAVAQRLRNAGLAAKVYKGEVRVDADAPIARTVARR